MCAPNESQCLLMEGGADVEQGRPANDGEAANSTSSAFGFLVDPFCNLCSCSWGKPSSSSCASDEQRQQLIYPGEKNKAKKASWMSVDFLIKSTKYVVSLSLLACCINVVTAGIFADQTPISKAAHPIIAFGVLWLLILWLGLLEGGQGSLVGLQHIQKAAYRDTHEMTHHCAILAHEGDNLNRFIIGRQFLVVLVVFAINLCCSVVEDHAAIPGVPDFAVRLLLESGLAVMIITVILGQLSAEVNATNCMLDFINTPFMLCTTIVCLAIESSGILHSVYLVQHIFAWCTGGEDSALEEVSKKNLAGRVFYWGRVAFSLVSLVLAMTVTLSALLNGQTTMFSDLPDAASLSIFIGLVCFLGMLEAMQIALFAMVTMPESELMEHPVAQANCKYVFHGTNFQAFLIGRQICVTMSMFLLAQLTTTDVDMDSGAEHVMGMSNGWQDFFNSGLPGALITTIVASLAWRIIASSFPIVFMTNPLVKPTIQLCLLLEASGVFSAAWLFAKSLKQVVGFQLDESYLGSAAPKDPHHHGADEETASLETASLETASECSESSSEYGATVH